MPRWRTLPRYDARIAGREVHSGPRADDWHSGRPGAADHRDHPEGRLLRFHEQVSVPESSARGGGAEHVCPAQIPEEQTRAIQDLALRAHRSLGLQVYSRVDVMLPEEGEPTVLEMNTIPGNDGGEPAAGGGGRGRDQLSGTVRADHRAFAEASGSKAHESDETTPARAQRARLEYAPAPAAASARRPGAFAQGDAASQPPRPGHHLESRARRGRLAPASIFGVRYGAQAALLRESRLSA